MVVLPRWAEQQAAKPSADDFPVNHYSSGPPSRAGEQWVEATAGLAGVDGIQGDYAEQLAAGAVSLDLDAGHRPPAEWMPRPAAEL